MISTYLKYFSIALGVVLSGTILCHASSADLKTDKAMYQYGEAIKVTFSGAPGLDSDWMCIVPVTSPDTDGGDYKYMPKGLNSSTLTFDPPAPGKYEVRAYYNYHKVGYVVAVRSAFSVTGDAEYTKAMEQRMERKVNTADSFETKVPPDKGIVYIFREPWSGSSDIDIQVLSNDKPVVVLGNSDYYPFVVPSGKLQFTTGSLLRSGTTSKVDAGLTGAAAVQVKPGHVYYLRVKVVPFAYYDNFLDNMPHQESADMIKSYNLKMRK
jgi:hypothetical protein